MPRRSKASNHSEVGGRFYLSGAVDERWPAEQLEGARKSDWRLCACCGARVGSGLNANGVVYCSKTCFLMMAAH